MAAYQGRLSELEAIGVTVIAGSIDPLQYAQQTVDSGITFPIAYGVTKEIAEQTGAWWEDRLGFIEPAGFVIGRGGIVLASMYTSGPIGSIDVDDVLDLIAKREQHLES